jgi:hypothetical protein
MTRDRDFKRLVRARMQATGEPYMVARAWLLRHSARPRPAGRFRRLAARAREVLASPRRGGPARMHPFERFTDQAQRALQLAQDEATRSGHGYIGTEHVLLGLLRQETSVAARALTALKVELSPTRARLAEVLGRPTPTGGHLAPTGRVKRVIELAFEESRRAGCAYVDTGHVLLGILREGHGVAAVVLREVGVTLAGAHDAIAAQPRDGDRVPYRCPRRSRRRSRGRAASRAGRARRRSRRSTCGGRWRDTPTRRRLPPPGDMAGGASHPRSMVVLRWCCGT